MFETIAVLSMILFASVAAWLFMMDRRAAHDDTAAKRPDDVSRRAP